MAGTEHTSGALVTTDQPPGEFSRDDLALLDDMPGASGGDLYAMSQDEISAELKHIRDFRRKNRAAYNKDDALQKRERDLLQAESPAAFIDEDLRDEWERSGSVTYWMTQATMNAEAILDRIADRQAFEDTFDDLPVSVQSAFFAELALQPDTRVRPATKSDIERFTTTQEGRDLVALWGDEAPRKVGIIQQRIERMMTRAKTQRDIDIGNAWFDGLSGGDAKAVLIELTG